jgi:hypothetical protein
VICSFHPAFAAADTKGQNFFSQNRKQMSGQALDDYLSSFPGVTANDNPLWGACSYADAQAAAANDPSTKIEPLVRFEASATYLGHPNAAGNVQAILPKVSTGAEAADASKAILAINMAKQRASLDGFTDGALLHLKLTARAVTCTGLFSKHSCLRLSLPLLA